MSAAFCNGVGYHCRKNGKMVSDTISAPLVIKMNGSIFVESGKFAWKNAVIHPLLLEEQFLEAYIKDAPKVLVNNNPYITYALPVATMLGYDYYGTIVFNRGVVWQFAVSDRLSGFSGNREDVLSLRDKHDRWAEALAIEFAGGNKIFCHWGRIERCVDVKSGMYSTVISYF